jgi:hypothetical protein
MIKIGKKWKVYEDRENYKNDYGKSQDISY